MLNQGQFDIGDWFEEDTAMSDFVSKTVEEARGEGAVWEGGKTHHPRPVITSHNVFVGGIATPQEREEFATRKYYHGSPTPIEPGEYVVPGRQVGKDLYNRGRNRTVFMSPEQKVAAAWGHQRAQQGVSYVHEVEPERLSEWHQRLAPEFQAERACCTSLASDR